MSDWFVGVDPGVTSLGVACIQGIEDAKALQLGKTLWVDVVHNPLPKVSGAAGVVAMIQELANVGRLTVPGPYQIAVEGQHYVRGGDAPARDIGRLSTVAGAAAAVLAPHAETLLMPTAVEWKGSIPKAVHQARTCTKLGWAWERKGGERGYCVPADPAIRGALPKQTDWKEALDAIGLALWVRAQVQLTKAALARA